MVAALLAGVAVWSGLTALRPALPTTVAVLVTSKALAGGAVISPGDVAVKRLPADVLPAQYLDDPAQAVGRPATVPLPMGAVMLPSSVVSRDALAAPGMAGLPGTLVSTAARLI